jgi:hypothetical protein
MLRHFRAFALASLFGRADSTAHASWETVLVHGVHPIIGNWLAVTPLGPAQLVFDARGNLLVVWPHSRDGPNGYFEYTTSATGFWCPVSASTLLLSAVGIDVDEAGIVVGMTTLTSRPAVDGDGNTFQSDGTTDRIATTTLGGTTTVWPGTDTSLAPISGIRMWPEATGTGLRGQHQSCCSEPDRGSH